MKRRANSRIGIEAVDNSQYIRKYIVTRELCGAQILTAREGYVDYHGDHLGYYDKDLQCFEIFGIVKCEIQKRHHNQQIPADIGDYEILTKRNYVI